MNNLDSTLKTKSEFENLHLGTAKQNGKQFWYVGNEKEFDDLMQEVFEHNCYSEVLTKKDMVIVDAGAYIGDTAYLFHDFAKTIYAVEPNDTSFEALKRNIELHKLDKVIPVHKALMAKTGKSKLYATGNESTGACVIPFRPAARGWDMETISFDDLCEQYEIGHIDLLKMDVEGAEFEILGSEGFAKVADRIDTIIMEAHPFFIPSRPSGTVWWMPYQLSKFGFVTQRIKTKVQWNVLTTFADGTRKMVPMEILVARKGAK